VHQFQPRGRSVLSRSVGVVISSHADCSTAADHSRFHMCNGNRRRMHVLHGKPIRATGRTGSEKRTPPLAEFTVARYSSAHVLRLPLASLYVRMAMESTCHWRCASDHQSSLTDSRHFFLTYETSLSLFPPISGRSGQTGRENRPIIDLKKSLQINSRN